MAKPDNASKRLKMMNRIHQCESLDPPCYASSLSHVNFIPHSSYVSFTPNGDNLISSSLSSCIRIWNYHTSRCIKSYTGHTSTKYNCPAIVVDPLAISPKQRNTTERQRLAQGDSSGLTMSNAGSTAVESVPQAWIVSGSDTNQVYIWDGQSKTLLQTLEEHSGQSTLSLFALEVYSPFRLTFWLYRRHGRGGSSSPFKPDDCHRSSGAG